MVGDRDGACVPPTTRTFNDLMSHEDKRKNDPTLVTFYELCKHFFARIDPAWCADFPGFLRIIRKYTVNSFRIHEGDDVGTGLYLGPSMFDHSCDANACGVFMGTSLYIKAMRDIHRFEDVSIEMYSIFVTLHLQDSGTPVRNEREIREVLILEIYHRSPKKIGCLSNTALTLNSCQDPWVQFEQNLKIRGSSRDRKETGRIADVSLFRGIRGGGRRQFI